MPPPRYYPCFLRKRKASVPEGLHLLRTAMISKVTIPSIPQPLSPLIVGERDSHTAAGSDPSASGASPLIAGRAVPTTTIASSTIPAPARKGEAWPRLSYIRPPTKGPAIRANDCTDWLPPCTLPCERLPAARDNKPPSEGPTRPSPIANTTVPANSDRLECRKATAPINR